MGEAHKYLTVGQLISQFESYRYRAEKYGYYDVIDNGETHRSLCRIGIMLSGIGDNSSWRLYLRDIEMILSNLSNMKSNLDLIKGREVNTMDSDYTSRVKGDLRNRDTAVAEVKKTKLDIIRAITSNVADLAVIHTDDEGLMDRGDLQISLASALRSTGYDPIDLVIDDDEE